MSAAAETTDGVDRYRLHALISQRLGALEAACRYALVGRAPTAQEWATGGSVLLFPRDRTRAAVDQQLAALADACQRARSIRDSAHYDDTAHARLARAALAVAASEAVDLLALVAPTAIGKPPSPANAIDVREQVAWLCRDERDRDAPTEQEDAAPLTRPGDRPHTADVRDGRIQQLPELALGDSDGEVVPVVAHTHESSPSVGAPGAGIAASLNTTVGAPADAAGALLRAGRPAGRLRRLLTGRRSTKP